MGCFSSKVASKAPAHSSPDNPVPSSPPTNNTSVANPRIRVAPLYSYNPWEVLKQGPSKRDGIAQRKRDQRALQKLVKAAKFGPQASLIDASTPPQTLSSRFLSGVAQYILSSPPKSIVVLAGAGISTSAGIPDFRSLGTGLYSKLAHLDLPYPEAMFDLSYFRENPMPFNSRAKDVYPGKFKPTVSHTFLALLHQKGLLKTLFTQNIDTLERRAGIPPEVIVEAHGSFASQSCIDCHASFPDELMKRAIENSEPAHCLDLECGGLVKPDVIFFGEQLPRRFHEKCKRLRKRARCL